MEKIIPFGEFMPDQPDLNNPGATVATNVYAAATSYKPMPTFAAMPNATLTGDCLGAGYGKSAAGVGYVFAGDETKLYKFNSSTIAFDDVSIVANYSGTEYWSFVEYGDTVIACNGINDPIQSFDMGTSTLFANLGGSSPKAKYLAVVRDFVVAGSVDYGSGHAPDTVGWSALGDHTDWVISAATQADSQIIPDAGEVMGVTGGQYGLVLCRDGVVRMSYVGSPVIFQFDRISQSKGCMSAGSVAQSNDLTFFLSDDGFYACDGNSVIPIGSEKVDRYFFADVKTDFTDNIRASVDPIRKLVIWSYPGSGSSGGVNNKLIMYNWQLQRWTTGDDAVAFLSRSISTGVTLDALDAVGGLDSLPASLDDPLWAEGNVVLMGFDGNQMGYYTGPPGTAVVETAEAQISQGQQSKLIEVWPYVDGGTTTIAVADRALPTDTVTFGDNVSLNGHGFAPVNSTNRFHRMRATITGDWSHAQGLKVVANPAGRL
ncbi:MAG: hypothetical protein ACPH3M_08295 [Candidatus Puniceispirillales bacterium]